MHSLPFLTNLPGVQARRFWHPGLSASGKGEAQANWGKGEVGKLICVLTLCRDSRGWPGTRAGGSCPPRGGGAVVTNLGQGAEKSICLAVAKLLATVVWFGSP